MDLSSVLYIRPIRSTLAHIRFKSKKNLGFFLCASLEGQFIKKKKLPKISGIQSEITTVAIKS